MAKRAKVVRVPATTNNITKGIINYLNAQGHFAFRVNSGGIFDPITGAFRANAKAGISDILCCVKLKRGSFQSPICPERGEFLAIEVKNAATKDKIRPTQTAFKNNVTSAAGTYHVAIGYNEFVKWFEAYYNYKIAE